MADDNDDAERTEDPTPRRLEEAARQGDIVKSQEVTTFVLLSAGTLAIALFGPAAAQSFAQHFRILLEQPDQIALSPAGAMDVARHVVWGMIAMMAAPVGLIVGAALASHVLQAPPNFTPGKLSPDLSRISPIKGLQRMFGMQGWINLGKGLAKIAVVGLVVWNVLWPERKRAMEVLDQGPRALAGTMMALALKIALATLAVLAIIAVLDYVLQRFEFYKRNRMSRHEIKEEHRQSEGDPAVKAKIRQLRMERSRKRMMARVPEATVVIMNPTHYAVALQYEAGKTAAPLCIAKGVDALALRIRDKAKEHNVPVIENPPLARALYAAVEIDEAVPPEHYKAVAQIIGYVMKLSGKLRAN